VDCTSETTDLQHSTMNTHEGQSRINGEVYMKNRCTILLGVSVGNPYYFKKETLENLFQMTEKNTNKVKNIFFRHSMHQCTHPSDVIVSMYSTRQRNGGMSHTISLSSPIFSLILRVQILKVCNIHSGI